MGSVSIEKKNWFLGKKKNKPLKLFADFNFCMKMGKAVFNFLMETYFPSERSVEQTWYCWNKDILHESKSSGVSLPEETLWQLTQLLMQNDTCGFRLKFTFLFGIHTFMLCHSLICNFQLSGTKITY